MFFIINSFNHQSIVVSVLKDFSENLETKTIFDEIEFLRCELLGSEKYPGIKKNLLDFDKEYINEKITQNIKYKKESEKVLDNCLKELINNYKEAQKPKGEIYPENIMHVG